MTKDCEEVGYWPIHMFPTFSNGAESAIFGGEILNKGGVPQHTRTEMGTGHFGDKGESKAAAINYIEIASYEGSPLSKLHEYEIKMSKPNCYNVMVQDSHPSNNGFSLYYGGPGYNLIRQCIH